jgi:hypothetical protein
MEFEISYHQEEYEYVFSDIFDPFDSIDHMR